MSYLDQVRKQIAKSTGLTGIEAGHIVNKLEKEGLDYQSFDWDTIGQDTYGYGHRTGGVHSTIKKMYGVNLEGPSERGMSFTEQIQMIQSSRTSKARELDDRLHARHVFKSSNKKGVAKWLKNPNRYDIEGVDD